ncbi:hypothetical protein D3C75_951030 [compost metagenome]
MVFEGAHQLGYRPGDNLHHFPFHPSAGWALGAHTHQNRVTVHGTAHVVGVDVHIRMILILRQKKAEALGMDLHPAFQ